MSETAAVLKLSRFNNPICPRGDTLPYPRHWDGELYCARCKRVWHIQEHLVLVRGEVEIKGSDKS